MKTASFTIDYDGISRVIISDIAVSDAFDPASPPESSTYKPFKSLWDTGATCTCISSHVAAELGLVPVGSSVMHTAGGIIDTNRYIVNIELPNKIAFQFVEVMEAELFETDVLVGMDIITAGDFALSNVDGSTTFSFRCPSTKRIDFIGQIENK